jgi:hypothetical protein
MRHLATWIARGALGFLVTMTGYAAMLAQVPQTLQSFPSQAQPPVLSAARDSEILHDRVTALGDRLSNIEGKLDVMEKLDIGLIIAMGGQLLHLALASKKRGGGQ